MQAAAVAISAVVGLRVDELVDQIAVGCVQLHTIKTGFQRIARSPGKVLHHGSDLSLRQRPRQAVLHHAADTGFGTFALGVDKHLHALSQQSRRRHGRRTTGLQIDVRDAAHVPQLGKHAATGSVHGGSYLLPAFNLLRAVNARRPGVALALGANLRAFADDQSRRGALSVIGCHQRRGHIALRCTRARQRRHDDAIR